MQKGMSFNDVAIVYLKGSAYRILFWYMSKDDPISIINNSNLIDKKDVLPFFLLYICIYIYKMNECIEETYYQKNRDVILNRDYYKNDKERLREQARDKYRNLSEEEKNEKRKYGRNRYHNMSEEKKQRLKEYQKNYREAEK